MKKRKRSRPLNRRVWGIVPPRSRAPLLYAMDQCKGLAWMNYRRGPWSQYDNDIAKAKQLGFTARRFRIVEE